MNKLQTERDHVISVHEQKVKKKGTSSIVHSKCITNLHHNHNHNHISLHKHKHKDTIYHRVQMQTRTKGLLGGLRNRLVPVVKHTANFFISSLALWVLCMVL